MLQHALLAHWHTLISQGLWCSTKVNNESIHENGFWQDCIKCKLNVNLSYEQNIEEGRYKKDRKVFCLWIQNRIFKIMANKPFLK